MDVRATIEMSDVETCESLVETTFNTLMKHNYIVKDNYAIVCQVYNRTKTGDYSLPTKEFDRITAMLYNELALTVGGKVYNICMRYLQAANSIFLKNTAQHSGVDETGRMLRPSAPAAAQSVNRQRVGNNRDEILNIESQIEVVSEEQIIQAAAPPTYESVVGKRVRSPASVELEDVDEERILMDVAHNLDVNGGDMQVSTVQDDQQQQQQQFHQEVQQHGRRLLRTFTAHGDGWATDAAADGQMYVNEVRLFLCTFKLCFVLTFFLGLTLIFILFDYA